MDIYTKIIQYNKNNKINKKNYNVNFQPNNILSLYENKKKIIVAKYIFFGIYQKDTKLWIWANSIPGISKKNIKYINKIKDMNHLFESNDDPNILLIYQFLTSDTLLINDIKLLEFLYQTLNYLSNSKTVIQTVDNNTIQVIGVNKIMEEYE